MNNRYIKKYIKTGILLLMVCIFPIYSKNITVTAKKTLKTQSLNSDLKEKIDIKLRNVFIKINTFSQKRKIFFYQKLQEHIIRKKQTQKNKDILNIYIYIENEIKNTYNFTNTETQNSSEPIKIVKHNSLILHFTRQGKHNEIIQNNKNKIQETGSVFIFKTSKDLSRKDIKNITTEIKKINSEILIFIDQEGGWINRYVEFEKGSEINSFFGKNLSKRDQKIRKIFPKKSGYFPSLEKIGKTYNTFTTNEDKKYFLETMAYIRLKTLKNNGINTYGLVLDLNRGNPVISNYARSFSTHIVSYKKLVDAFTLASKKTGIILYFKHFPGHGEGKIDSHKGILNYIGHEKYVKENIELFKYAGEKNPYAGVMVAHMFIPQTLQQTFTQILQKSHFILTDDLGMQGYKKAHKQKKHNLFFTTDVILGYNNLITVDTRGDYYIK